MLFVALILFLKWIIVMSKLLIRIQSVSDLITNSSSEVFLCYNDTEMTIDQLKEFIYEYNRSHQFEGDWEEWQKMSDRERRQFDRPGGMGGFLEVYSYEECKEEDIYLYAFDRLDDPQNYILVDTDWCHETTIKWIRRNLNAQYIE